jgi:acetyl esterase/lipase
MSKSTLDLVDPELKAALTSRRPLRLDDQVLPRSREFITRLAAQSPPRESSQVSLEELLVSSLYDAPPVRVLMYRPRASEGPLPAMIHLHGGGYVMGLPEMRDADNQRLAAELGCLIVSVDYRLAPEAPYPSALQDAYSVLLWLHDCSSELGVDRSRIGIRGESAGGGLAAAVALYARDFDGPPLLFQHLKAAMIDDRTAIRQNNPNVGEFVWTQDHNLFGWRALLGAEPGGIDISPYAAAARAADLTGLPQTFISVGALDLFLEENIDYSTRLCRAGIAVELHVYPGAYHGFQTADRSRVAIQAEHDSVEALRRFLHG